MKKLLFALILTALVSTAFAAEDNCEKENDKWDVNASVLPYDEVQINTDEGTWLSVDISPDGEDIIFDLLGDIYRIPFTGVAANTLQPVNTLPAHDP